MNIQIFDLIFHCNIIGFMGMFFAGIADALSAELPSLRKVTIRQVLGEFSNVRAVAEGEADIGMTTPPVCASMGYRGVGPFTKEMKNLRAIGSLPHDDRMAWAVPADSGINSIENMKDNPMRLVIPGKEFPVRFAAEKILDAYGMSPEFLKSCGWQIVDENRCQTVPLVVLQGKADAIIHEAFNSPPWRNLAQSRPMRFLPIREDILQRMEEMYGFRRAILTKGKHPGIQEDISGIDFSDILIFVREDMPEDLAYLITKIVVEKREKVFEVHFQVGESRLLNVPIDPKGLCRNIGGIPLHVAAEQYYKEKGYL